MATTEPAIFPGLATSTLLTATWAFCTLVWSVFSPPHRTLPARFVLFQPLWVLRIWLKDPTSVQDLAICLILHGVYGLWTGPLKPPALPEWGSLDWSQGALLVHLQVFALLGACGGLASLIVYRGHQLESSHKSGPFSTQPIEEALLPPLLIPSRTKHTRMFPQKHTFTYSYLYVGIPVGLQGRVGNVLSVDGDKPAWFHVMSAAYLGRGTAQHGLAEKLKRYLHTQGVSDQDYAFAYLVTAPRFLGYSFNPVSFWYLYDTETLLKYMILEVNNTTDERRMYLLKADHSKQESNPQGEVNEVHFTNVWAKDFHVSPFSSRKGSYSLKAIDPLAAFQETGQVRLDNNIVLRSSKEHAKLVARVWSEGSPKEAANMTYIELTRFIVEWWWVGLATIPRTLWQALRLFFGKKLRVWFKPEVTVTSVGRSPTADEEVLEAYFREYMAFVLKNSSQPFRLVYTSAIGACEETTLYSPGFTYEQDHKQTLTLKVLTPAFYSRLAHYAHMTEAFDRECLATNDKSRTLAIEPSEVLSAFLDTAKSLAQNARADMAKATLLGKLRWSCLKRLRCPPAVGSYPSNSTLLDGEYNVEDIRTFQYSELDIFVQHNVTDSAKYRRIATKLFLAERMIFGIPLLVELLDMILRAGLLFAAMVFFGTFDLYDILQPRDYKSDDIALCVLGLLLANSVHFWSFLKG